MRLSRFYFTVPVQVFKCLIYNGSSENGKDGINVKDTWQTSERTCLLNGYTNIGKSET